VLQANAQQVIGPEAANQVSYRWFKTVRGPINLIVRLIINNWSEKYNAVHRTNPESMKGSRAPAAVKQL
jgi:hypothetical protein